MPETHYRDIALVHGCDLGQLSPDLAERFVPVPPDDATKAWIDEALDHPHGGAKAALHDLAVRVMSELGSSDRSRTCEVRLLGTAQWDYLLGGQPGGRLLDVGAGDGAVTAELAPMFDEVVTTETSEPMAERLRERGWRCHVIDLARQDFPDPEAYFDTATVLNVLDTTSRPRALLADARERVLEEGCVIVALPLPYAPQVEEGPQTVEPEEHLPLSGKSWERDLQDLVEKVLEPAHLRVESFCRAPYLSRGDRERPVTVLDDAVVVCRRN